MLRRTSVDANPPHRVAPGPGPIRVLVPVLNRPDRADPFLASLRATSDAAVLFLMSPRDGREANAVRHVVRRYRGVTARIVPWRNGPCDYARKINLGVNVTDEPWLFQAGDDLWFHDGWEQAVMEYADRFRVIGTNDLCNPRVMGGSHSTHTLVARSYVVERGTADEKGKMLHEGYRHNFCDDELVQTAIRRREFVFARDARVEHLHPMAGSTDLDSTYRIGLEGFEADRRAFHARRRLWR